MLGELLRAKFGLGTNPNDACSRKCMVEITSRQRARDVLNLETRFGQDRIGHRVNRFKQNGFR